MSSIAESVEHYGQGNKTLSLRFQVGLRKFWQNSLELDEKKNVLRRNFFHEVLQCVKQKKK